ncbi:MAG TPA: hypothetical protein VLV90_02805 [Burkholderiales bacterium]|nr:hypothetical protein [Burkholderiales bacterium]
MMERVAALVAALLVAAPLHAQTEEARTLEIDGGATIAYTLRQYPPEATRAVDAKALAPRSALDTAKLLNLHLSAGDIEEAALLSNSPRRRFEVLRDYRASVGEEEFKRVFAQYLTPANRLVAEIAIDNHRLLVWDLREGATRIAGQYFVEVEGRYLVDDVPNDVRTRLRWVLEAYRSGKLAP